VGGREGGRGVRTDLCGAEKGEATEDGLSLYVGKVGGGWEGREGGREGNEKEGWGEGGREGGRERRTAAMSLPRARTHCPGGEATRMRTEGGGGREGGREEGRYGKSSDIERRGSKGGEEGGREGDDNSTKIESSKRKERRGG